MKIAILLTLGFVLTTDSLLSQNQKVWQWLRPSGGILDDGIAGIGCDSENNLCVAGSFMDTLHCGEKNIISTGVRDIFIARYKEDGSVSDIWQGGGKRNDEANCMAVTNNNEIVIGGNMIDTVTFGSLYSPAIGPRLFISKLSNQGNFEWISTIIPAIASLTLLDIDAEGKIYAAGVFRDNLATGNFSLNSQGGSDIFLTRLSSSGEIEELVSFGGSGNDVISALTITPSGKILLAGESTNTYSFLGFSLDPIPAPFKEGAFIVSLNENMTVNWTTQIMSYESLSITSLITDPQDHIYVGGTFNFNFVTEESEITTQGYTDGLLIKYDSSGKLLWKKGFGSWYYDYVNSLAIDEQGRIIACGSIGDTLQIDNLIIPTVGNNSSMTIQFSKDGNATWGDAISGKGLMSNNDAVFDQQGNLYITGAFYDTIKKNAEIYTSHGDYDFYLGMYYSCRDRAEILGEEAICPGSSIELSIINGYNQVIWNDSLYNALTITVDKPGLYWVTMVDNHQCTLADTTQITLKEISGFSLGEDMSIAVDSSVVLQAPVDFSDFTWQDNSHNDTFLAHAENNEPGTRRFWLTAVDPAGCTETDTLNISFYIPSGLKHPVKEGTVLYPNPVNDMLTCTFTDNMLPISTVEIIDIHGRIILNQPIERDQTASVIKIDFSHVIPGVYYLRLRNKDGNLSDGLCVVKEK